MRLLLTATLLSLAFSVTAEAQDKWFEARSEHFTIVSNGREGRGKNVLEDLEQLRRLITQIFPSQKVDGAKPAVFYLFKNEKSMRPFQPTVSGQHEEWAGIYRPTFLRNIVLVRGDGKSDVVRKLLYGQYMHLLESYNEADYPVWLSNGLSRFYGNTEISKKQASIGRMRPEYQRVLGEFRRLPVRELFAVDHSSENYRDLTKRPLFDAQSWALVHFLLIGRIQDNGPERLGRYLGMLRQDREPILAFQEAMGATLDEIDAAVAVYIRKNIVQYLKVELPPLEMEKDFQITKLDDVSAQAHLGRLFMSAHHDDEAQAVLARSVEADPDQVVAYEALASLRRRQEKSAESMAFLERAIRNGSTNPHVHLRRAQLFVRLKADDASSMTEQALEPVLGSLRLVIRDAPELTDAARLFGYLSLSSADQRPQAHRVVTKALEREPGNASLVFILGQLHSRDGSYAAARVIFRKLLDRKLDPQLIASVRRHYDFADAKVNFEADQAALATRANASVTAVPAERTPADTKEGSPGGTPPLGPRAGDREAREVRGRLIRFDCSDGHRFIIRSGDVEYALSIADLARVRILENGERAGVRDFYCGALDELVVAHYIPEASTPSPVRSGRVVSVDFIGR